MAVQKISKDVTRAISATRQADGSLVVEDAAAIAALQAVPSGPYIAISGNVTLTDDASNAGIAAGTHILQGLSYICTVALTVGLPDSLTLTGATVFLAPGSGNLSLDPTGTATLNGAATTLTRTRANNYTGVAVVHMGAGAYGANGA